MLPPEATLESRTEAPEGPATQVGDDERVPCNHPGAPLQSTCQCRWTARYANADQVFILPAAESKARNLQNFFPFPQQEEEEEASEGDDNEVAEQKEDFLAEGS